MCLIQDLLFSSGEGKRCAYELFLEIGSHIRQCALMIDAISQNSFYLTPISYGPDFDIVYWCIHILLLAFHIFMIQS